MVEFYSTIKHLKLYSGIQASDLDIEDLELNELLELFLVQAKGYIDSYTKRNFHNEVTNGKLVEIPPEIHNIALRIAANMVDQTQARRANGVTKVEDLTYKATEDVVFTDNLKGDLKPYIKKVSFSFKRVGGTNV